MFFGANFADDASTPKPPKAPADGAPLQDPALEEEDDLGEEVNETIAALLPWGVSLVFHVGLVLLAVFIVWSVGTVQDEEVIVPIARLSATPGAPLTMKQTTKVSEASRSAMRSVSKTTTQTTATVNTKADTNTELIGVLGGASSKASPFGTAISSGTGFGASMYGTGGNAKRIVYLVDASGSLLDTLPFVIVELKRSIGELSDAQEFTVIFFQQDKALEVVPPGLKKASSENKERVIKWIDPSTGNVIPQGQSNPLAAVKRALQYRPQLMFLLSDNITGAGKYEIDQDRLLKEIQRANVGGTKINTIQFLYPDPLTRVGLKGTLQQIADSTGGIYKYLDARELNLE